MLKSFKGGFTKVQIWEVSWIVCVLSIQIQGYKYVLIYLSRIIMQVADILVLFVNAWFGGVSSGAALAVEWCCGIDRIDRSVTWHLRKSSCDLLLCERWDTLRGYSVPRHYARWSRKYCVVGIASALSSVATQIWWAEKTSYPSLMSVQWDCWSWLKRDEVGRASFALP